MILSRSGAIQVSFHHVSVNNRTLFLGLALPFPPQFTPTCMLAAAFGVVRPENCIRSPSDEAALRTGGARSHIIATWPVRTHSFIFFVPTEEPSWLDAWQTYLPHAKRVFERCVQDNIDGRLLSHTDLIDCRAIASCVGNRSRPTRGIVVLAVPQTQIGLAVPEGDMYVAWHNFHMGHEDPDDRVVMYLMPPYRMN